VFGQLENTTNCNECLNTLRNIRIPPNEIFVECKFQNRVINCTESFKELVIYAELCYTFNGFGIYRKEQEEEQQEEWSIDEGFKPTATLDAYPRRALRAGPNFGLSILLKINKQDVDYTCSGSPGFLVMYILT
jgi:Amiloride-sensitive sodium channel